MPKYVALLRAINVGKHIVKMDRLRELFEELEFTNVETFIASGQVIFDTRAKDTAKLEAKIEKHLREALGYDVETFIRTPDELAKIAKRVDPGKNVLYVCFTRAKPSVAAQKKLAEYNNDIDQFIVHDREVFWVCSKTSTQSKFTGALLEKIIEMPATARNVNTVNRLVAIYAR